MMTAYDIIQELGGVRYVAELLGIENPNTVQYWTQPGRSIPAERFSAILGLPRARRIGLTYAKLHSIRAADLGHPAE